MLLNVRGEFCDEVDFAHVEGDPDMLIHPISNTLSPITWLKSDTAQVLATFTELDGTRSFGSILVMYLIKALQLLEGYGLKTRCGHRVGVLSAQER